MQIPFVELQVHSANLPAPPHWFIERLGALPPSQRNRILRLRERILGFDPRIQEIAEQNSIVYGKPGKGRHCAELIAAMQLSVSNGQVEGQINRLKLLKRQMYGRAGTDLLMRRFLLAS